MSGPISGELTLDRKDNAVTSLMMLMRFSPKSGVCECEGRVPGEELWQYVRGGYCHKLSHSDFTFRGFGYIHLEVLAGVASFHSRFTPANTSILVLFFEKCLI